MDQSTNVDIGKRMLLFRDRTGRTQRWCAEAAGITIQTWYQIEKGYQQPKPVTAEKIEAVIGKVVPAAGVYGDAT